MEIGPQLSTLIDNRRDGSIVDALHKARSINRHNDIFSKVLTLQQINQCCTKMISVYNRKRIINMHFVQGYGYKKIRKCLNHQIDVKTIRRYCNDYAEALEKGGKEAADHYLYKEVKYTAISRLRTKLTPEIRTLIEECVNANLAKQEKLMGKQIMRKTDIFELLRNQGFTDISYQSVCKYAMS